MTKYPNQQHVYITPVKLVSKNTPRSIFSFDIVHSTDSDPPIPHICKYASENLHENHRKQVNNVTKTVSVTNPIMNFILLWKISGSSILICIFRMVFLMVMISFGEAKTFRVVKLTYDIINILCHAQRYVVLQHVESHQKFLLQKQLKILGVMLNDKIRERSAI